MISTLRPITAGSPANSLRHPLWLSTITGRPANRSSSAGINGAPERCLDPQHLEEVAGDEGGSRETALDARPVRRSIAKASVKTLVSRRIAS